MIMYEIKEEKTGEVLVDKLPTLEEAIIIANYYRNNLNISTTVTECKTIAVLKKHSNRKKEYKSIYIQYMGELQEMGNIL